jgi:hypothetical protein
MKGAKGSNRGQKQCPWHIAITTSDDGDDKEADDSSEEYVATAECNFMR